MKNKEKIIDVLEIIFKLMFMTVGLLQYSSLTAGTIIISIVQWPTVALGGLLLLWRLIHFRDYTRQRGIWLLIAFAASFVLSLVLNMSYGVYAGVRTFIFLCFEVGLLFAFDIKSPQEKVLRHTRILAIYFIAATAVLSLISFGLMAAGYCKIFEPEKGSPYPTYVIGFAWGRLFGAYWDPNIGSVMAVLAILLSVPLFIKHKNVFVRIVLVLNIVLELFYVEFSDSRCGKVCIMIGFFVLALLYSLKLLRTKKAALKVLLSVAVAAVVSVVAVLSVSLCGEIYTAVMTNPGNPNGSHQIIGREQDIAHDVSNRRFDIWGSAMEIFKSSPMVGVSHDNVVDYAKDHMPDTYILTNDHMVFASMHNVLFDILVAQGAIGILLYLAAVLTVAVSVIRKYSAFVSDEHCFGYSALFALVVTVFASSMFMTEIVYVITPLTLMFWPALGCLSSFAAQLKNPEASQAALSEEKA